MIVTTREWRRPAFADDPQVVERVRDMLAEIERGGSDAIRGFSRKFDGFEPELVLLKPFDEYGLDPELSRALRVAADRVRRFAEFQMESYRDRSFEDEFGSYGQRVRPVEHAVAYVPGGRFPLPSTALMTLIPAQVAGCPVRTAMSPSVRPEILAAASLAGATGFVRLGGAQAIAAAALGSDWNPPADMVVGPGNAYVNAAKGLLQNRIRIDTLAGPSELMILGDGTTPTKWVMYDMLAQSEHDPRAVSVLVSRSRAELEAMISHLNAVEGGAEQLESGQIQLVFSESVEESVALSNRMAPEHLTVCDAGVGLEDLRHYGSLFVGPHSAVALGDYCSGPNHTLPTNGFARKKAGLHVGDFLRIQTVQQINPETYRELAVTGARLAEAEGLVNHRRSLEIRFDEKSGFGRD